MRCQRLHGESNYWSKVLCRRHSFIHSFILFSQEKGEKRSSKRGHRGQETQKEGRTKGHEEEQKEGKIKCPPFSFSRLLWQKRFISLLLPPRATLIAFVSVPCSSPPSSFSSLPLSTFVFRRTEPKNWKGFFEGSEAKGREAEREKERAQNGRRNTPPTTQTGPPPVMIKPVPESGELP
mmetsp:Transcript_46872/g.92544  ORF Transcript_46872/g.92544 Transcript_46872/m.92544 type:complete len:179 (+) Transcript_46872:348-884(+)